VARISVASAVANAGIMPNTPLSSLAVTMVFPPETIVDLRSLRRHFYEAAPWLLSALLTVVQTNCQTTYHHRLFILYRVTSQSLALII
jgi:hypothetical protein